MLRRVVIWSESEEMMRATGTDGLRESIPASISTVLMHGESLWALTENLERTCRSNENRIQCKFYCVHQTCNLSVHYPDLGQRRLQLTLALVF